MKGARRPREYSAGPIVRAPALFLTGAVCLVLSFSFARFSPAAARKPAASKGHQGRGKHNSSHLPPPHVDLNSFDLGAGVAVVEVTGASRPPESRFFVFTDERNRRFVPSLSECQQSPGTVAGGVKMASADPGPGQKEPPPNSTGSAPDEEGKRGDNRAQKPGHWGCTLGIPRIYQRANLVGLSVEIHGQVVVVPGDKVQAAWALARTQAPLSPSTERPRPPGAPWARPRAVPDGGPSPGANEVESEGEQE